jgi:hypothetical protein
LSELKSIKCLVFVLKGSLISEPFSYWLKSPKKRQITPLSTIHLIENAQRSDLAPIFGDLSQSEKLSEIKPPLATKK